MKAILDRRWLVPIEVIELIQEVKSDNSYSADAKYTVVGEATDYNIIQDSQLLDSNEYNLHKFELENEQLQKAKKELDTMKLKMRREEAVAKILKERRGMSRENVARYVDSCSTWELSSASSDKAREWLRKNK